MVAEVASIEVTLKLLGIDRYQSDMRGAGSITEQTSARVTRSMDSIASSTQRASRASEGLSRNDSAFRALGISALRADTSVAALNKTITLVGTAVGGLAGGVAANAFKNYADSATTIGNKLAVVVPIQKDRAAVDLEIFNTAQRTRTQYEATASLFSRMSLSSRDLGATQGDVLRVVETTQKALKTGGATSGEAASIATQLTQALGSGRGLAGDELKSIAENAPVLLQAIAKEFGVTTGALKDMGANGELEAKRVFQAILKAGTEVDRVFAATTPTIADGIQQIDNALTRYIGNVDKSIGATRGLVKGLEFVAANLDTIGDGAVLAVAALAGPIGSRLLGGASQRVAAPFRDALAASRSGVEAAGASFDAARLARVDARQQYDRARGGLNEFDAQPRFRQAAPEVQRNYERQAAQVDKLRDAVAKTAEKESAALIKRADAEAVVARVSETAANRVVSARETLTKREAALNDLIGKRPALEEAAAAAGVNVSRKQQGGYYDSLYKVVEQRDKLAATNATIALTKSNIEALDQAIARERSAKTHSDFLPQAVARRQSEIDRLPGLTAQRDDIGRVLNEREKALVEAERKIGEAQASERDKAGKRLADIDNSISRARAAVAGQVSKVVEAELRANETLIASAEKRARVQADLDAKAIAASAQRRAAEQAFGEAQTRLGGLAGQVGGSAASQRASAVQAVATAETVLTRALYQEEEALGRVQAAGRNASVVKVALTGATTAARAAVSGLVGMLGGPFGAALTLASVGLIGYEIYQARAAAQAENHAKALENLIVRTQELNALTTKGQVRTEAERQQDIAGGRDAIRGVRDIRNKVLDQYDAASSLAQRKSGASAFDEAGVAIGLPNDLDKAAQRLGLSLDQVVSGVRTLTPGTEEASRATKQLSEIMTEAARADPAYRDKAVAAADLAKAEDAASKKVRDRADAERLAKDLEARARSRKYLYEADEGGPLVKAPIFSAEEAKREIESVKPYVQSLGESITKVGEDSFKFPELAEMRTQLQGAVQDIAKARIEAQQAVSGQIVPRELAETIQQFAESKSSVEDYASALQDARDKMPNFRPLIDSLIAANEKGLNASATLAEIGGKIDALDGRQANISINITTSLAKIKMDDVKAVEDQATAADKAMTELQSKTRNLQLQASGQTAKAKALEMKESTPGLDLKSTTTEIEKQEALQKQISDNKKKGRGGKSQGEKDADSLQKKLRELDQDTRTEAIDDVSKKTVRFAQDAKVATDQIESFIKAAESGDTSKLPPVMEEIYQKLMKLEGVKLAQSKLDEIIPGRKLARELKELDAAADASPEIAAHIMQIKQAVAADAAPEWAKDGSKAISSFAESAITDFSSIQSAAESLGKELIKIALRVALLKPLETSLTSLISGGGGGDILGGLGSLLGLGGGGSGAASAGVGAGLEGATFIPTFASGVSSLGVVDGPGTGTSDSILARISKGESIIPAGVTAKHMPLIKALVEDRLPRFAAGQVAMAASSMRVPAVSGMAMDTAAAQGAGENADRKRTPIDLSVTVNGARGNREIEEMVGRGIATGLSQYDRLLPSRIVEFQKRAG